MYIFTEGLSFAFFLYFFFLCVYFIFLMCICKYVLYMCVYMCVCKSFFLFFILYSFLFLFLLIYSPFLKKNLSLQCFLFSSYTLFFYFVNHARFGCVMCNVWMSLCSFFVVVLVFLCFSFALLRFSFFVFGFPFLNFFSCSFSFIIENYIFFPIPTFLICEKLIMSTRKPLPLHLPITSSTFPLHSIHFL